MKTKLAIKQAALLLFNHQGMMNVTLRQVATTLKKSYGNITYHFPKKNELLHALYEDMLDELKALGAKMQLKISLETLLEAPKRSFDISLKYLFFIKDFVELQRHYPELAQQIMQHNEQRKETYRPMLKQLQKEGLLRQDLSSNDLDYLMELSGAMRSFFFIRLSPQDFENPDLKANFTAYVNQLIKPYLSPKGLGLASYLQ